MLFERRLVYFETIFILTKKTRPNTLRFKWLEWFVTDVALVDSPYETVKKSGVWKVIIYRLRGGAEDFRGDHLILERKKGRSVVTENPKGGIAENFGRGRTTQICLENEDMGGGIEKVIKIY